MAIIHRSTKLNLFSLALTRPVVLDYIWSAENGGDIGFAQCHLVWTGLPDLGLPGPKSSFSNFSGKLFENFQFLNQHPLQRIKRQRKQKKIQVNRITGFRDTASRRLKSVENDAFSDYISQLFLPYNLFRATNGPKLYRF